MIPIKQVDAWLWNTVAPLRPDQGQSWNMNKRKLHYTCNQLGLENRTTWVGGRLVNRFTPWMKGSLWCVSKQGTWEPAIVMWEFCKTKLTDFHLFSHPYQQSHPSSIFKMHGDHHKENLSAVCTCALWYCAQALTFTAPAITSQGSSRSHAY